MTVAQATAEADVVFQSFMRDTNQTAARRARSARIALTPASHGNDGLRVRFGRPLVALMGITAVVLLIACANIANLLLACGVSRAREFAVRVATGASTGRLLRQALTETLLLFLLGAGAGLVIAPLSIKGLTGFFAIGRNPIVLDVQYDWRLTRVTLSVSANQPPATLGPGVADAIRKVHPKVLVSDVIGVQEQIDATLTSERLLSTLATAFALLAVGLAAIGLYGVLGYSVAKRRTEFGVRLALGAHPGRVATEVVRSVMPQVLAGIALGLLVALPATRAAEALLFGVAPGDARTYALAVAILALAATAAAWLPARLAARTDPLRALRGE